VARRSMHHRIKRSTTGALGQVTTAPASRQRRRYATLKATSRPSLTRSVQNCSAGTAVRLYRLIGAQHAWYGTPLNVPGQVPFNPDFDAATGVTTNDVVWNFFAAHPKR
jgi:poly(3-hydroxybutyrate) depolymerase